MKLRKRKSQLAQSAATVDPLDADEPDYKPIDWRLIKRLFGLLAPYRRQYALGVAVGIVMVILEMLSPLFMQRLIDTATGYQADPGAAGRSEREAIRHVGLIVGLWAVTLGVALVLQRVGILIMTGAGERVQFGLRRAVFDHLQQLSMSYFDRTKLGRIISRCTSDISSLREINVWGLDTVLKNSVMMVVAAVMLFKTESRLFLAVVWLGPVLFIANRVYRSHISRAYQAVREGYTRLATNLAENITGVRVVAAFERQRWNLGVFNQLQEANTRNAIRAGRINGVYQPLLQYIGFIGRAIILLYGGYLVASGRIDSGVGAVVAAFLYWDWFMAPMLNFGNFYNQLMMAMASAERVFDLLDTKPEVEDVPDARPMPPIQGRVCFDHVTFAYKPGVNVLHDVDFEVAPGTMVALVGHTGSGKSTIAALLARFYQPQQGRILVDGLNIRHVTGESYHRQMGMVSQNNYLFSGTVLDNIRYARPQASRDEVLAAARDLGTADAIAQLRDGLDTQVGERGASLSLGQRQLICFTRAFLIDPRILILDEATSAVDTETERMIQRSLEQLLLGRTTFVVAHRLSTILRAHLILVMDHGRIVERGRHRDLLHRGGAYARLYEEFTKPPRQVSVS